MEENKKTQSKILKWIKNHKIATAISLIAILVILPSIALFLVYISNNLMRVSDDFIGKEMSYEAGMPDSYRGEASREAYDTGRTDIPGIQVITSNITIESDKAVKEEVEIKKLTEEYNGYVEESSLSESITLIRVNMKLRVPSEDFEEFFEELRSSTEVESFSVRDYRIDIEQRETDLDTIQKAIAMYSEMLEEIRSMPIERETIEVMSEIINREVNLKRQENHLITSLQESRRQSEYSTVWVTIEEKVSPKIWPEDLGENFRENLQKSFQSIGNSITSVIGNSLALFVKAVEWVLYVIIIVIPFWILAVIIKKIYIKRNK